jgi:periplasmic protein TonB
VARHTPALKEGHAPARDRLITTLFLAALVHGLIIVGVTFNAVAKGTSGAPGMEVLLVSDELPESERNASATYLSQRTQLGAGNTREQVAAQHRPSTVALLAHQGTADGNTLADSGDAGGASDEHVLTSTGWSTEVRYLADAGDAGSVQDRPVRVAAAPSEQPGPTDDTDPEQLKGPKRDELYVTPDTETSTVAPYLDRWRSKVERIGTLNFPNVARTSGATTSPLLEVTLSADGRIQSAVVRRSSGDASLDQAALQTLKLASPFDPFPPELAGSYRVLHFQYEWQFSGGRFTGGAVSTAP